MDDVSQLPPLLPSASQRFHGRKTSGPGLTSWLSVWKQEARRARNLAASEDFQVPRMHEWEAWETASLAMQEVGVLPPPKSDESAPFDNHPQGRGK